MQYQCRAIIPPLNLLRVISNAKWAPLVAAREEEDNSYGSMPSLQSYGSDTESDGASDLDSAIDVTLLYRYGELEDEWSETTEEETMEELNMYEILAHYVEYDFSLANP